MEESLVALEIAAGIYKQNDLVRVSTLLSVIEEDAVKIFDTFTWRDGEKDDKITDVLAKFDENCESRTQVIYGCFKVLEGSNTLKLRLTIYLSP